LTTALIVIGVLLGLAVLLLSVPVDLCADFQGRNETWRGEARLRWLFGLLDKRLEPGEGKSEEGESDKPKPKRKKKQRDHRRKSGRRALALLRSPGFVRRVLRFVASLLRAARIRTLRLRGRIGLDDPADTGELWGVVGALPWALPKPAGAEITLHPDFTEAVFELEGVAHLRVYPAQVLFRAGQFALSPRTIRALYAALRA